MEREHLDAPTAVELLRRQEALQAEAQQLIVQLDLFTMLSPAGKPEQIGSSVSGLMVWRLCMMLTRSGCASAFTRRGSLISLIDLTVLR